MHGNVFPNLIAGSDHQLNARAPIPEILEALAAAGERKHAAAGAARGAAGDHDMGLHAYAGAELHVLGNWAERPEPFFGKPGPRIDARTRVNLGHEAAGSTILALITASAAVLVSTDA